MASADPSAVPHVTHSVTADRQTIHLGTRRSLLARIQTDIVHEALKRVWPDKQYEIHAMATQGDKNQVTALHEFGAKALWTQELELGLLEGSLDGVVHSLKDMPTQLPATLTIGAITARSDPRDALVVRPDLLDKYRSLQSLPEGAVIGTSSVRRSAQLKRLYPHLEFANVRGNVNTRLSKLDDPSNNYTALVLAAAGLLRLDMRHRCTQFLSSKDGGVYWAVGQGALGVEVREGDAEMERLLRGRGKGGRVACERSTRACLCERSVMRALEGGCSVPLGIETEWAGKSGPKFTGAASRGADPAVPKGAGEEEGEEEVDQEWEDELVVRCIVVSVDGKEAVDTELRRNIPNRHAAIEFGLEVAADLVKKGAGKILDKINLDRKIIEEQGNA